MSKPRVSIHWFRRDLRLHDNHSLYRALAEHGEVLPLFIFDTEILGRLGSRQDRRVDLIHRLVADLKRSLEERGSSMLVVSGRPAEVWGKLLEQFDIIAVTANGDHEPYARWRDDEVRNTLADRGIAFRTFKDTSIFERGEVLKNDGTPYTVCTPYIRKWRGQFSPQDAEAFPSGDLLHKLHRTAPLPFPSLSALGFEPTDVQMPASQPADELLLNYHRTRDLPAVHGTSRMSVNLRFGTVSVRELVRKAWEISPVYINELIWREFFMQILWHFPHPERAFKSDHDRIEWRKDEAGFEAWCQGRTGYPLVDAGMRELLATGFMHNRVRMVVAGFLCKHLLIDWRWGEAWFAEKLLDFELSSNNGNWQWAAGSGCDAAPYFRVFNPSTQLKRFDPELNYVKHWVPEYGSANYVRPMVVHEVARQRAISTYKAALSGRKASNDHKHELFA